MNTEPEWDLIERCRRGSAAAFEPLVRRYEPQAAAIAEAYLLDADDAADAVQDAFVRAYRGLGRLTRGSAFGPWFRTILRNLCRDRLSSARRRHQVPLAAAHQTLDDAELHDVEREEFARRVRSALAQLSAPHREVLVLKEMEGMSYTEIAAELGIASGTVASRIHHARAALKAVLLSQGISTEDMAS